MTTFKGGNEAKTICSRVANKASQSMLIVSYRIEGHVMEGNVRDLYLEMINRIIILILSFTPSIN
jgi:hypothetical protein